MTQFILSSMQRTKSTDVFVQIKISKCKCQNNLSTLQKDRTETQFPSSPIHIRRNKNILFHPMIRNHILKYTCCIQLSMCPFSLPFLHHVFSNVSSDFMPERMHSHIGCIYWTFLHCVISNVPSEQKGP